MKMSFQHINKRSFKVVCFFILGIMIFAYLIFVIPTFLHDIVYGPSPYSQYNSVSDFIDKNGKESFYNFIYPTYYIDNSKELTLIDYDDIHIDTSYNPKLFYSFNFQRLGEDKVNFDFYVDYNSEDDSILDDYKKIDKNIYYLNEDNSIQFIYHTNVKDVTIVISGNEIDSHFEVEKYYDIGIKMIKDSISLNSN